MTIRFDRRTPVCWLEPTVQPDAHRGPRAWFLCPVVAHNVLLAESMVKGLNMIERVVLGLAGAGVRSREELASRSGLPRPLVHLVVDELVAKQLLDALLVPTDVARHELEEAEGCDRPSISAVVFTNPWTGLLWPRVALGDPPQAREWSWFSRDGAQQCRFTDGPLEKPIQGVATVLACDPVDVRPPRARHVLEALDLHRRAFFAYRERNERIPERLKPIVAVRAVPCNAPPVPTYVLTFAYLPQRSVVDHGWAAADPFGLGRSDEMARIIRACASQDGVRARLSDMIEKATERVSGETAAVHLAVQRDAGESVRRRLGGDRDEIRGPWRPLFDRLVDAEAELLRSQTRAGEKEGNVASKCYVALEELLRVLLKVYGRPRSLGDLLDHDRRQSRSNLEHRAAQIGFEIPPGESGLPMFELGRGKVNAVVAYDGRGVAALLAACLLAAGEQQANPMSAIARRCPRALHYVQGVIEARNPESHGGGAQVRRDGEELLDGLYELLDALSGVLGTRPAATAERPPAGAELEDLQLRIRAQAIHAVQARYGPTLDLRPNLYDRLVRMENRLEWIRDAERVPDDWSAARPTSLEFMREAAPAVECALAELLRSGGRQVDPRRSSDAGASRQIASELGFTLGAFDDGALYSRPEKVSRALKACQGSLAELSRALLLAAEADADHPIRDLAGFSPHWFDAVGAVETARGHADTPLGSVQEAVELAEQVHRIVQDALDALTGRRRPPMQSGCKPHAESTPQPSR